MPFGGQSDANVLTSSKVAFIQLLRNEVMKEIKSTLLLYWYKSK